MPLQHLAFFLINAALAVAMLALDRRRIRDYVFLWLFGLAAAFVFETATTAAGFWHYHSEPKILIISLYTWLLYIPYLSFCYFLGNRLAGKPGSSKMGGGRVRQSG